MQALAQALTQACQCERPPYNGMLISLSGTLTLAARSLREMAVAQYYCVINYAIINAA